MSFPGVIDRPLLSDELSIYLDNTKAIPLSALAAFLGKVDRAAQAVEGMEGFFLELSAFGLGSNELRFRIKGPGRAQIEDIQRQERTVAATEKAANMGAIGAGASVVSAVAAVIALSVTSGAANPATYRITNRYDIQTIFVRAPDEPPHVISRREINRGRELRLSARHAKARRHQEIESNTLLSEMREKGFADLAGWLYYDEQNRPFFETINGNHFPIHSQQPLGYDSSPVAIRVIVQDSQEGLHLEIVEYLAKLSSI